MKFKLPEKLLKTAKLGYLYAVSANDGTTAKHGRLVIKHSTQHAQAGDVEWVTIHETGLRVDFDGRLIFHHRGTLRLLTLAREEHVSIRARAPSLSHGSENTKTRGIPVGYVSIIVGPDAYEDTIHFSTFDNLISSDFTLQENCAWEAQKTPSRWADYPVANAA